MVQFFKEFIYYRVSVCVQEGILSTMGVHPELKCNIVFGGSSVELLSRDVSEPGCLIEYGHLCFI